MGNTKMENRLAVIAGILIMLFVGILAYAHSPLYTLTSSQTLSPIAADASSTFTVTNAQFNGDSTGIMIEVSSSSFTCLVQYRYKSVNGYYDTPYSGVTTLLNTTANTEQAFFTNAIPIKAGANNIDIYISLTNKNSITKTPLVRVYTINWR